MAEMSGIVGAHADSPRSGVGGSGANALEEDVERRIQQHNRVEPRIELFLIRHRAKDEERALMMRVEQRLDPVLTPALFDTPVGERLLVAEAVVIRVDDAA
jgi:hypothetical protein